MTFGVLDHLPVGRRQLLKVSQGPPVVDDPVLAGQHQQGWLHDQARHVLDPLCRSRSWRPSSRPFPDADHEGRRR